MPEMQVIAVAALEDERGEARLAWVVLSFDEDGRLINARSADITEIPNTEVGCLDTIDASIGMEV